MTRATFPHVHRTFLPFIASLFIAAPTLAVEVNPEGFGQVLLYPYYLGRSEPGGYATLLTITNTTDHIKAVRVRFREGAQGAVAGEINLYLDRRDTWSGAVLAVGSGAGIASVDASCTLPALSRDANAPTLLSGGAIGGREGYIEVFEMGDYGPAANAAPGSVADAVQHLLGVPKNCARALTDTGAESSPGTGGLFGNATLITPLGGMEFTYPATALAHFNDARSLFSGPGSATPSLMNAEPAASVVRDEALGTVRTQWSNGVDAVSAVLMRRSISNEFGLQAVTQSSTEWIVAMPTRVHYLPQGAAPKAPFVGTPGADSQCELVPSERLDGGSLYDRTGHSTGLSGVIFIGRSPILARAFCWSVTSIAFNNVWVFGSANQLAGTVKADGSDLSTHGTPTTTYSEGWAKFDFDGVELVPPEVASAYTHRLVGGATTILKRDGTVETRANATYRGLPAIGFGATIFNNGMLDVDGKTVFSAYGGTTPHRFKASIE